MKITDLIEHYYSHRVYENQLKKILYSQNPKKVIYKLNTKKQIPLLIQYFAFL